MGIRKQCGLVAVLGLALAFPTLAHAFNLDGDWRGSVRCRERTPDVRKRRVAFEGLLRITHTGEAIGMSLHTGEFIRPYAGMTVPDVKRPDIKGEAAFAACGTADAPSDPAFAEIGRLIVLADLGRGRGRLRGESLYTVDGDTIGTCLWRFKWETTVDPGLPLDCP
jgi:hypothetical protein